MHSEPERLMTEKELADRIGCSIWTVRYWRRRGLGPRYFKLERTIGMRASDVDAWMAARMMGKHNTPHAEMAEAA